MASVILALNLLHSKLPSKAPFIYVMSFTCPRSLAKLALKALSYIWESLIFICSQIKYLVM